jgi:hypothetical protein
VTVAAGLTVECVRYLPETHRAAEALNGFRRGASAVGIELATTEAYHGHSPWLLLWGPGAPERRAAMQRHTAAGGHAIALDLAYWSRDQKVRLTVDAPHPQALVMRRPLPAYRLKADSPPIADNYWRPHGPVVIAGIGRKATTQYGAEVVEAWEERQAEACRARWPLRPVVRRPKPLTPGTPDRDLRDASLVVTWHSNIAVDAIRLGIPAVCVDGAAAAVCPSEIPADPRPLPAEVRATFLQNLAWFQWAPGEAAHCWRFLLELLA